MYLEDFLALAQVGQVNMYLTVETAGTQQGIVKHIHTVGGSKDNDTAIGSEAIHLGEQGIQRVLTLIVTAHGRILGSGTAYGVDFVDENDAGRLLLGLTEQVADTAGSHTDEHLNEVGTTH